MEAHIENILDELIMRYPKLKPNKEAIAKAYTLMRSAYDRGGKLLVAGNGGSAADSEHIVGELMKGFTRRRPVDTDFRAKLIEADRDRGAKIADRLQGALPAIALTGHTALSTAYSNDVDGELVFAQQLYGYGCEGDVFLALSTSGNSRNVLAAVTVAKAKDIKVIALTGGTGGRLKQAADCAIVVDGHETYKIQELHLPIYHALCRMLEETWFTE